MNQGVREEAKIEKKKRKIKTKKKEKERKRGLQKE